MTFHDEVHATNESVSYQYLKLLSLLLATMLVSPNGKEKELRKAILDFAKDMGWPVIDDEYCGEIIK